MNSLDKHSKALEFDEVLEELAEFTSCEDARYNAVHLKPETDLDLAKALLKQKKTKIPDDFYIFQ